jgi:hypothetical protein
VLGVCANRAVPEAQRRELIAEYRRGMPPPVVHDRQLELPANTIAQAAEPLAPSEPADVDPSKLDPSALLSTPEQELHNAKVSWKQPRLEREALEELRQRQYRSRLREEAIERERNRIRARAATQPDRFEQQRIENDRRFEQAKREVHAERGSPRY